MACHGNTNAIELFFVIAALDARDDFLVMHRRPVGADEMSTGIDTRLSRCLPGRSRRNWRGCLQDKWGRLRRRDASGSRSIPARSHAIVDSFTYSGERIAGALIMIILTAGRGRDRSISVAALMATPFLIPEQWCSVNRCLRIPLDKEFMFNALVD